MRAPEIKRKGGRDISANVEVEDSRRGTRGQLVEGTVEVQLPEIFVPRPSAATVAGELAEGTVTVRSFYRYFSQYLRRRLLGLLSSGRGGSRSRRAWRGSPIAGGR